MASPQQWPSQNGAVETQSPLLAAGVHTAAGRESSQANHADKGDGAVEHTSPRRMSQLGGDVMMFTSPLFAAGAVKASDQRTAVEAGVSAAAEGDTSPGTTSSSTAAHASSDNTGAHVAVSGAGAVASTSLVQPSAGVGNSQQSANTPNAGVEMTAVSSSSRLRAGSGSTTRRHVDNGPSRSKRVPSRLRHGGRGRRPGVASRRGNSRHDRSASGASSDTFEAAGANTSPVQRTQPRRTARKRFSMFSFRRKPGEDIVGAANPMLAAGVAPDRRQKPPSRRESLAREAMEAEVKLAAEAAADRERHDRQVMLKTLNIWRFARKSRKAVLRQRMASDEEVAKHNVYMFWIACVSIVLMIIDEESRWEYGPEYLYGVYDKIDGTAMWVWTDFAIPIVNAVLVWRLIVHYMVLSQTKMRLWLLKSRWEGFWASTLKWKFLAELIVCVLQPIPVRNFTFAGKTWLRHFGLLMFLRVYIAARVLRDKSNIYRNRHRAKDLGLRLHVGFMSSLRAELRRRPLFWMSWAISGTVVVFTYVVFVMERFARYNGSDGNIITWNDSMWFVVATLTTVGYGDVTPSNSKVYYPAIVEGFLSLVLTSVFISVVIDKLSMSTQERKLFRMVSRQNVDKTYEKRARALVRMWLEYIVQRRRMLKKFQRRGRAPPANAASMWARLKPFVKDTRRARHERSKLGSAEHETDPVELLLALTKTVNKMHGEMKHMQRQMNALQGRHGGVSRSPSVSSLGVGSAAGRPFGPRSTRPRSVPSSGGMAAASKSGSGARRSMHGRKGRA